MCSGCAGSYEDGDEEIGERGVRRDATAFGMSSGAGGAHEWPDGAASIRTGSRPAHFAAFEETYDVVVGAEHLVEVRVVRANATVTPALAPPAERFSFSAATIPRAQYYQTLPPSPAPNQPSACTPSIRLCFAALAMVWAVAVGAWLIIK